MKRTFSAIFLLLMGTAGCGVNLEWLPVYENISGATGGGGTSTDLTSNFDVIKFANLSGVSNESFSPSGIAIDEIKDAVYVADKTNKRVLEFTSAGEFVGEFVTGITTGTVGGIATDSAGTVYVADAVGNRILRYNSGGGSSGSIPLTGIVGLVGDIAMSPDQTFIYAAYPGNNRIRKVLLDGTDISDITSVNAPKGIGFVTTTGSTGFSYISNSANHTVVGLDASGITLANRTFGGLGSGRGKLNTPLGITIFDSTVYVVDSGNARIHAFDLTGLPRGVIGKSGTALGEFTEPVAITSDSNGALYVAEINSIQKFSPKP